MRDKVIQTYAGTLDLAKRLVGDVPDDRFAELPHPGAKCPGWVLGHLCLGSGMGAASLVGEEDLAGVPAAWAAACMPGKEPSGSRDAYASKAELLAELARVHGVFAERFDGASEDVLAKEFPNPEYRSFFPTLGDAAFYLLAYHEAWHLGQLSEWRLACGLGPAG